MGKKEMRNTPNPDFNWNAYEKSLIGPMADQAQDGVYSAEKIEQSYAASIQALDEKSIVTGTVISITPKDVLISLGQKSEGAISVAEFRYMPELKVGDKVEVYIEEREDAAGLLVLSHKKARIQHSWDRINTAQEQNQIVTGYIKCRTKGGLIVDVFGIEAFLPGSQIDVKPIRDYDSYVGKNIELLVIKVNHEFKNIVVSHKALIEVEMETQKDQIISRLEKGQVLEGVVKNMTSYGVFVDLGGVDGLIHITDLSWGRIAHPSEVVAVDQKINVVILDFDPEKKRIALGLKQLTPHPWEALDPNIKLGDVLQGRITQLYDYGAFMEISPGIEGLIHVSEMSWSQHLRSAQDFFKVGDITSAKVLSIEKEDHKISLSIKLLTQDPWENIATRFPVGSQQKAVVRNFTNFGVFAELAAGVDGIIHIEDLAWGKVKHPSEIVQLGATIDVVVLDLDANARRMQLGYKQLLANPWDKVEQAYRDSAVITGTVQEVKEKYAMVLLDNQLEGTCPIRHLMKENKKLAVKSEVLEFKVLEVSRDDKRIILSHGGVYDKALEEEGKSDKRRTKKVEHRGNSLDMDILNELKSRLDDK